MFLQNVPFLTENVAVIAQIGGFGIGIVFGATVLLTNFCTMGAIADAVTHGDYRRFRSWVFAAAVALAGTQTLVAMGALDLRETVYLQGRMNWAGAIGGGLIFGFGMVLSGGCPSRNVARAGAGDLRAAVILLVLAAFAYVTMTGLLAPFRMFVERETSVDFPFGAAPSLDAFAAAIFGDGSGTITRPFMAALLTGAALLYCFADAGFRSSWKHMLGGGIIGLTAVAGWVVTTSARDEFAVLAPPPASLSFVRPVADSIVYFTRYTGIQSMGFGVAVVLGAVVGAMIVALATGKFKVTGFADQADTRRNLAGATLMGVGGILALGCTIGQGVVGISTMAAASFLAFAAMALGAVAGVKHLASRV
jgi:uncharacterized membrane protein YedE/YeeE